jgi:hypothetical protein
MQRYYKITVINGVEERGRSSDEDASRHLSGGPFN